MLRNGQAVEKLSKDELLSRYHGAYTTARTVDRTGIFELEMHCQRLYDTGVAVFSRPPEGGEVAPAAPDASAMLRAIGVEGVRALVKREMRAALQRLGAAEGPAPPRDGNGDFQVTLLLTKDTVGEHTPADRGFDVFVYAQPLPYVQPMVDVLALRAERPHPTIKDVQWVHDRQALEAETRRAGVNEAVMFDADGHISEGLQTNFFAITADGALATAPDELVLSGTVRKVVLEVAAQMSIPVLLQTPSVHDAASWDSCFICSTSRLVRPIRHFSVPAFGLTLEFPEEGTVAHRVQQAVLDELRKHAESLDVEASDV